MRQIWFAILATALPAVGFADQVFLRGGGHLEGVVVEKSDTKVTMEVGPGRVSLPMSQVERIVGGSSALSEYLQRARFAVDAKGWLALGLFAKDHELLTQAREAFEHVVALDPGNATAQAALGNVLLGTRWVAPEEAYRARGYVPFEGRWMTPEERNELIRERESDAAQERARAEATARAREAEAQAEAADAARRAAEASYGAGIPVYGGYGAGIYGGYGYPMGYVPFVFRHRVPPSVVVVNRPPRVTPAPQMTTPKPPSGPFAGVPLRHP
jgi:hypothetical protein